VFAQHPPHGQSVLPQTADFTLRSRPETKKDTLQVVNHTHAPHTFWQGVAWVRPSLHAQQGAPPEQPPCGTASLAALLRVRLHTGAAGHGAQWPRRHEVRRTLRGVPWQPCCWASGFVVPNGGARHTFLFFAVHLHTDGPHGAMGAGEEHGWFNLGTQTLTADR